ncbi:sulfotransferase domain-containing protein [Candidatus Pelagibacter sp. HIMB1715]|uniref:sulfotransferase domain-containing protein n=1 Tax=Candidatus Pelagibacter sp. HIMB1715 TaxID=3413369 RepID=UPI003F85E39F
MIIWIASYPKSGNTWLRALISTYYFSKDGIFNDRLLKNIDQFPTSNYFRDFNHNKSIPGDTCKYWIKAQEKINSKIDIKFFKTHNVFGKVNNFDFTNSQNSVGCIYVVRDPRNVITSLRNHYQLNNDQAFNWITDEKNFIYNVLEFEKEGYSDFQFISSWSTNYKSWKIQKKIPIKIIKYEDLLNYTYVIFSDVLKFIQEITNDSSSLDKDKIKKTLRSTSFEVLKKNEIKNGFSEAVPKKDERDRKITFFNLGPDNNWKKILDKDIKEKTEKAFDSYLKELNYK